MKIQLIKFKSVDSTNNTIRRIKNGKTKPALIITDIQKKGEDNTEESGYRVKGIFSKYFAEMYKNL